MNIIGVTGAAGAGKDTTADVLVREHGFVKIALADEMKRICSRVFGFTEEQLWGPSALRNEPDPRWPLGGNGLGFLTPRYALQLLGTEWGRTCSEDVWVRGAIQAAMWLLEGPVSEGPGVKGFPRYTARDGLNWDLFGNEEHAREVGRWRGPVPGVVIPDVRFDNEARAIRAAGGRIWKKYGDPSVRVSDEKWRSHSSEAGVSEQLIDEYFAWQSPESLAADVSARLCR